jgi:hypothetical protein
MNGLGEALHGRIRIQFVDAHGLEEAGVDGGGIFKEFIETVGGCSCCFLHACFLRAPCVSGKGPSGQTNCAAHSAASAAQQLGRWSMSSRRLCLPCPALPAFACLQVVKEGFDPNVGLFKATTDNKLYPNPHAQVSGWMAGWLA